MPHSDKAWHKDHIWMKNSCSHNTGPEKDFKIYSCHVRNACHVRNKLKNLYIIIHFFTINSLLDI